MKEQTEPDSSNRSEVIPWGESVQGDVCYSIIAKSNHEDKSKEGKMLPGQVALPKRVCESAKQVRLVASSL